MIWEAVERLFQSCPGGRAVGCCRAIRPAGPRQDESPYGLNQTASRKTGRQAQTACGELITVFQIFQMKHRNAQPSPAAGFASHTVTAPNRSVSGAAEPSQGKDLGGGEPEQHIAATIREAK